MHSKKYFKAREYAVKNWGNLVAQADPFNGGAGVSIADQLEMYCNISTHMASDIAKGVEIEKEIVSLEKLVFNTP